MLCWSRWVQLSDLADFNTSCRVSYFGGSIVGMNRIHLCGSRAITASSDMRITTLCERSMAPVAALQRGWV